MKRIPDSNDGEVEKAVAEVAGTRDVATKVDIANLETRPTNRMYAVAAVIIAAVALTAKFL